MPAVEDGDQIPTKREARGDKPANQAAHFWRDDSP
jgi:hypothetical protein